MRYRRTSVVWRRSEFEAVAASGSRRWPASAAAAESAALAISAT